MKTGTGKIKIGIALLLTLSVVGCSVSSVITAAQLVADAITVAAPIVSAFGGPAASAISNYVVAAASGLNCLISAGEAAGATPASIAAATTTCLASVISGPGVLLPSVPANVVNAIKAIANGIAALINTYGHVPTNAASKLPMNFTFKDRVRLHSMRKQMDKAISTITNK